MVDPTQLVEPPDPGVRPGFLKRVLRRIKGPPRDVTDPGVSREITLIAFLAWVGLGSDGLSSSAYGPDEAFRALFPEHTYLALALALLTTFTVFIICACYVRVIEEFPQGGGGYVVASALLGSRAGVVAGSALLIDYVLTISVSIASGAQLTFSFFPEKLKFLALPFGLILVVSLTLLNLRGVKESVTSLLPIFVLFLLTHAILLVAGIVEHARDVGAVVSSIGTSFAQDRNWFGGVWPWMLFLIFARAYSMGAGTYTGIEAVSNGIGIMREPRVQTAKRTMLYLALSLAVTASGILVLYLLVGVKPVDERTPLNYLLVEKVARDWPLGGVFTVLAVGSEVALLLVAAQSAFIAGPRVMASMATDGWLPRRFAALSDRLAMQNGAILIGVAAALLLFYAEGSVVVLVTMYAINVFATFSLSNLGMLKLTLGKSYRALPKWTRHALLHAVGLVLCLGILSITVIEKFTKGAWLTIVVTFGLVLVCALIRRHYRNVLVKIAELDRIFAAMPPEPGAPAVPPQLEPKEPTAALLVGGYRGLGIHCFLTVRKMFPAFYKNYVFISVAVVDSNALKDEEEIEALRTRTQAELDKYVKLANDSGCPATSRMAIGADVVEEASALCRGVAKEFPRAHFFAGNLIFEREAWYDRILHNESAFAIQRRLQFEGVTTIVLPVRVMIGPRMKGTG